MDLEQKRQNYIKKKLKHNSLVKFENITIVQVWRKYI